MPVELEFDYEETCKQMEKFSQEDIDLLRDWSVKLDPAKCVPKDLSDKQLVLFYNSCESDVSRTKTCIEKYYQIRKNAPELFDNRSTTSPEIIQSLEALEFAYFPGKSVEGYDVIFHRLRLTEPSRYHLDVGCKLLFMTVDACLSERGPQPGALFLFDMRGVRLGHITRISLSVLRKFFQYVQEAMPVRMRAIHVLNSEPALDKILLLIRPFMDKKFFDMITFHKKNEDLSEFYRSVVPRSCLPAEYGGALPAVEQLHAAAARRLHLLQPLWRAEQTQRAVASNTTTTTTTTTATAVAHNFSKLDID